MSETIEKEIRLYRVTEDDGSNMRHVPSIEVPGEPPLMRGKKNWMLVSRHRVSIPVPELVEA